MSGFSGVLTEILVYVRVYDCGAYFRPLRRHYFSYCEDSLMMAPMEYRNM